jgi:hypothetical protein
MVGSAKARKGANVAKACYDKAIPIYVMPLDRCLELNVSRLQEVTFGDC